MASKAKNGDVTALLLVKGSDINLINNKGEDALHVATGDSLIAIRLFKENDGAALKKRFPVISSLDLPLNLKPSKLPLRV